MMVGVTGDRFVDDCRVSDGESGAGVAGDDRDDKPSQNEITRSVRQEHEAQVARWAQMPVWAAQDYQRVQRAFAALNAAVDAALTARVTADEAFEALPKRLRDLVRSPAVVMESVAQIHHEAQRISERFGSALVGYYPPNWWSVAQLDDDAAMTIMQEGIPLAWVPRAAVVADLIAAPDPAARDAILVAKAPEVVADCRRCLAEVVDGDLQDLAALTGDALRALEQASPTAAQALAANVFDTLLRDMRHRGTLFSGSPRWFKYRHVTGGITPVSEETLVGVYRATCVLTPVLKALAEFNVETDPAPGRFTRHATAHRAGSIQYTPANAVIAIMLTTSLLREAQESGW
jgi:hypothetical protein